MTDDYDDMKQRWHGVPAEEPEIRPEDALTTENRCRRIPPERGNSASTCTLDNRNQQDQPGAGE